MEGMIYPTDFAGPEELVQIARLAEELRFHSVWGNDHMTTQRYVREEFAEPPNYWEPLVTYAYLAAETESLRFGTGVLVAPMRRDIVVLAKQIATLDHFSGGRFILGMGVGAYREEFEALHPTWELAHRGDLLEESVQALRTLFENRVANWQGDYFQFKDVEMYPKPLQTPLPIYIGGNNPNAVRRAVAYAQGWMPAGMSPDLLQKHVNRARELAAQQGRDFNELEIAPQFIFCVDRTHEAAVRRFRQSQMYNHLVSLKQSTLKDQAGVSFVEANLIGTASEVLEKVQRLQEVGVTHLAGTLFAVNELDELFEQMHIFSEEIAPNL